MYFIFLSQLNARVDIASNCVRKKMNIGIGSNVMNTLGCRLVLFNK